MQRWFTRSPATPRVADPIHALLSPHTAACDAAPLATSGPSQRRPLLAHEARRTGLSGNLATLDGCPAAESVQPQPDSLVLGSSRIPQETGHRRAC